LIFQVGKVLSIRLTVAVSSQVFQARSSSSKVKDQLPVKVYQVVPALFVMLIHVLLNHVSTIFISWLVSQVVLYSIFAVGKVYKSYHSIANQYTLSAL